MDSSIIESVDVVIETCFSRDAGKPLCKVEHFIWKDGFFYLKWNISDQHEPDSTFYQPVIPFLKSNGKYVFRNERNKDICVEAVEYFKTLGALDIKQIKPTPFEDEPNSLPATSKEGQPWESTNFQSWLEQGQKVFRVDGLHKQLWNLYRLWTEYFSCFQFIGDQQTFKHVPFIMYDLESLYFGNDYRPLESIMTTLCACRTKECPLFMLVRGESEQFIAANLFELRIEFKHKYETGSGYLIHSISIHPKHIQKQILETKNFQLFSEQLKSWTWDFRCRQHEFPSTLKERLKLIG